MLAHLRNRAALALIVPALAGALFHAGPLRAQASPVVSSQITVSGTEATLDLELTGNRDLRITLQGGRLLLNGDEAGRFPAGSPLEAAWRELLGRAIAVEPDALGATLLAWEPPTGLSADATGAADALRARLRSALDTGVGGIVASNLPGATGGQAGLGTLVTSGERLRLLAAAVDDLDLDAGDLQVVGAGETRRIAAGETLDASFIVLDGDLLVDGTLDGDVILLGGRLTIGPDGRVRGSMRWADARIVGSTSRISGDIEEIDGASAFRVLGGPPAPPSVDIGEEIRRGVAEATRSARGRWLSPLADIGEGIAGLFQTFVTFGILFAAGLVVLYFFPRHIEVVARTARTAAARSALVGAAGLVLAIPAWVVGTVLLAVSIIGIPGLLIWIPGVPVAIVAAIGLGYVGVARNLGQWLSGRDIGPLGRLDRTRPAVHIGAGLVVLLSAFALANVFGMAGWLDLFEVLFYVLGGVLTVLAVCVGVGAVILSRAGRDPAYAGPGWGPIGDEGLDGDAGDPLD